MQILSKLTSPRGAPGSARGRQASGGALSGIRGQMLGDGSFSCSLGTLTPEEVELARVNFRKFDVDCDGIISRADFGAAMARHDPSWRDAAKTTQLDGMYAAVDLDGTGQVSFEKFSVMRVRKKLTAMERANAHAAAETQHRQQQLLAATLPSAPPHYPPPPPRPAMPRLQIPPPGSPRGPGLVEGGAGGGGGGAYCSAAQQLGSELASLRDQHTARLQSARAQQHAAARQQQQQLALSARGAPPPPPHPHSARSQAQSARLQSPLAAQQHAAAAAATAAAYASLGPASCHAARAASSLPLHPAVAPLQLPAYGGGYGGGYGLTARGEAAAGSGSGFASPRTTNFLMALSTAYYEQVRCEV